MNNKNEEIKSLNEILQGEYMAVDVFNVFISRIDNEKEKSILQQVQNTNRDNIKTLANHIQNLGGKPHENLGLKGRIADMELSMEIGTKADSSKVIRKSIDGMTKGINMTEKTLRGTLSEESRNLVGGILENDRKSIEKLQSLI